MLTSVLVLAPSRVLGQAKIPVQKKLKLPVPYFRGIWWSAHEQSRWLFSIQMTSQHELLVFEPDKNGRWPLVRVSRWWTEKPESAVLNIPGWSGKDAKHLESLNTDLQITPNGDYAIALGEARWDKPEEGAAREHDDIVTVVDLKRWQIVASTHAASFDLGTSAGTQVLDNEHLLFAGTRSDSAKSILSYLVVSLPTLSPVAHCTIQVPHLTASEMNRNAPERQKENNDDVCRNILTMSAAKSISELQTFAATGRRPLPQTIVARSVSIVPSAAGNWYGVDPIHSELIALNSQGEMLRRQHSRNLLCENQPVKGPAWICDCNIVGVSEKENVLLTYCVTKHDNLFGLQVWLKQWLSVFRANDLSEIGLIALPGQKETQAAIAAVNGRTFVLAISLGASVNVYQVPAN